MSHFVRTQSDATWTTGNYVTLASDWQDLDAKTTSQINGDLGGCWGPTQAISLVGTYATQRIVISGPLVVDFGGSLNASSATAAFRLAAGDWPMFGANHALRTRTIVNACIQRQASPLWLWQNDLVYGGVQSIACTVQFVPFGINFITGAIQSGLVMSSDGSRPTVALFQPKFLLPLRVHDGSRFVSATLTFRVPSARASAPFTPPQMRIVRTDAAGNVTLLKSIASGANVLGFVPVASPTSGTAWFNQGLVQSFTYMCDQNQTVDCSQFTYWAEIVEEVGTRTAIATSTCDGTLVRERKLDVTACSALASGAVNNITLSGQQTVDGVTVGAPGSPGYGGTQDRVLLTAQTDKSQNGIWIAQNGASWVRSSDLGGAADFTPGFLVHVINGTANIGSMWECQSPTGQHAGTLYSTATTTVGNPIVFQRRVARGNIYHAVACNFDSIADMRYQ